MEVLFESETSVDPVIAGDENSNKVEAEVDSLTTQVNQSAENVVSTKGSSYKNSKLGKNSHNIYTSTFGRTSRPTLSQSLSFPAKTRTSNLMKPVVEPTSACARSNSGNRRGLSGLKPVKTVMKVKEDDATSSTASPYYD